MGGLRDQIFFVCIILTEIMFSIYMLVLLLTVVLYSGLCAKERTHYDVLNIPKSASLDDVKHGM